MKITRTSPHTGRDNTMDLPVTQAQIDRWKNRNLKVQDAFPALSADQREFLLTGYTPEDWTAMFPPCCDSCDHSIVRQGEDVFTLLCNCAASPFFEKKVDEEFKCEHHVSA